MIAANHDIVIADLVHEAIANIPAGAAGRSGDRNVLISAIWDALCTTSDDRWIPRVTRHGGARATLADFQAWLIQSLRFTDASGRPLVVLASASPGVTSPGISASETHTERTSYHYVVDRIAGHDDYRPRPTPGVVIDRPKWLAKQLERGR